jgi:hypothetical protein
MNRQRYKLIIPRVRRAWDIRIVKFVGSRESRDFLKVAEKRIRFCEIDDGQESSLLCINRRTTQRWTVLLNLLVKALKNEHSLRLVSNQTT